MEIRASFSSSLESYYEYICSPTNVNTHCDICHFSKQVRLPILVRDSKSTSAFDIVQCDVWGPYKNSTLDNCTLFLTIIDDFTKCTWVYLMSTKIQVFSLIKNFIAYVSAQFKTYVQIRRSDNGT